MAKAAEDQQVLDSSVDVLAVRQQRLATEADEKIRLLTEYGLARLRDCKSSRELNHQLIQRMKMLVTQEHRIFKTCNSLLETCRSICDLCAEGNTVSEEVLSPVIEDLNEFLSDLHHNMLQRSDNLNTILEAEREGLEKFTKLKSDIEGEKTKVKLLTFGGAVAAGAVASCPVTLCAGLILATLYSSGHHENANKLLEGLDEDIKRTNGPIKYMETLQINMDDTVKEVDRTTGALTAGRSNRLTRRVDIVEDEINMLRVRSCQNFVALAGSPTLAKHFGLTETRRLAEVRQALTQAGGAAA